MVTKIIFSLICVCLAAGLRTTVYDQHSKAPNDASRQQSRSTSQGKLQSNTNSRDISIHNNTANNKHAINSYDPVIIGLHQPTPNRDSHSQPKLEATTAKFQHISERHLPTSYKSQDKTGNHQPASAHFQSTRGPVLISDHFQSQPARIQPSHARVTTSSHKQSTTNDYKQLHGKDQPRTQKVQPFTIYKSVPTSSINYPHKTETLISSINNFLLPSDEFLCNDGKFRILSSSKCNGEIDCPDGSDELPELCLIPSQYPPKATTNFNSFADIFQLPDDVFLCNDGKFRIRSSSKCDGQIDCPDGSDELPSLCLASEAINPPSDTKQCTDKEFQCPSGKCVSKNNIDIKDKECWATGDINKDDQKKHCTSAELLCDKNTKCISTKNRCNGISDCLDNTDEMISPWTNIVGTASFKCANGYCVSQLAVCNGIDDCGDFSDEKSCKDAVHTTKKFASRKDSLCSDYTCPSGECIQNHQICNGHNDCRDNSDETACDMRKASRFLSTNKGLIISVSVLGGAVILIIGAVIIITVCYRRKYRALRAQTVREDTQPPPYWQVISAAEPGNDQKGEKGQTEGNFISAGVSALPQ